jgi:hypothetical protein
MTEAEFLDQECKRAEGAIKATAQALGHEAMEIVDPRRLTREHPWKLVAVAAAAGFVASKLFTGEEPPRPEIRDKPVPRKRLFTLSRVFAVSRELLAVARPIIDTVWAAALAAAEGQHGNGEHLSQTPSNPPPDYPSQS